MSLQKVPSCRQCVWGDFRAHLPFLDPLITSPAAAFLFLASCTGSTFDAAAAFEIAAAAACAASFFAASSASAAFRPLAAVAVEGGIAFAAGALGAPLVVELAGAFNEGSRKRAAALNPPFSAMRVFESARESTNIGEAING
jgi:hypothetical protein